MNGLGAKVYVIFVDLFMLILAFYMLNSSFGRQIFQGVDLPQAEQTDMVQNESLGLGVSLLPSGQILVDGEDASLERLGDILGLSDRERVDLAVDRSVTWDHVSDVVKIVAASGKQVCIVYESGP